MKGLNRVIQDIKYGENIDLYVLVVAAIVVAVLNLFGILSITHKLGLFFNKIPGGGNIL